jgi:holdfast attachment protein HfaA
MTIATRTSALSLLAIVAASGLAAAAPASAQSARSAPTYAGEFERPVGYGYGEETQPYDARTRDANGNRVIVDGRIIVGDDVSSLPNGLYNFNGLGQGSGGFSGAGRFLENTSVAANQLNVITQGSFNTVVVNSTQINNGDQTVVLNGALNLND